MKFIDYTGGGTRTGQPWNYSTTSAGTCSFTLSATGTAYLIQGVVAYGGKLSNATLSIQCSGGAALFTGYVGSAGPIPFHFPMNLEVVERNTLSVGINAVGTGAINIYGYQIQL